MSAIDRHWATPLTIATFVLMAGTGVLMFFHLDNGAQKFVHEWLGWGLVAAAVLHVAANWFAFKRHVMSRKLGTWAPALAVVLMAASFAVPQSEEGGGSPPALAIRAITQAPIGEVAGLTGRSAEQLRQELAAKGIQLADDQATLAQATKGDREQVGAALRVMFGGARTPAQPAGE